MYEKNLTEEFRLRLSSRDMDFLRELSTERSVSVSECVRSIISEYRRGIELQDILKNAITVANDMKKNDVTEGRLSHGDTKTSIDN